jgi:hypothetical protein
LQNGASQSPSSTDPGNNGVTNGYNGNGAQSGSGMAKNLQDTNNSTNNQPLANEMGTPMTLADLERQQQTPPDTQNNSNQ